ncbi:unnamed protein product [Auanema sp. JU1783]|nr:unnamed protein product [Auanema sp. JU1783]
MIRARSCISHLIKMDSSRQTDKHGRKKLIKHLVLDTGAIIANVNLHHLADNYYAPPDIIKELKWKKSKIALELLPFEIKFREPSPKSLKAVIDAAKQTGDFKSLSGPDMKVLALTFELMNEFSNKVVAEVSETDLAEVTKALEEKVKLEEANAAAAEEKDKEEGEEGSEDERNKLPEGFCEDGDSDDDEGWINEDNLAGALKKLGAFEVSEELVVGCLSTDFALQNVLLFMHLGLVSLEGLRIRKLRSFLLRCRACYNTTTNMEKEFCPSCGNKSLYKCPVSVDENGEQILHLNYRRLANKRGLKYALAAPKGGKHSTDEKLFEDQRIPQNRMAKVHLDPLADGPFSMHDTTSRSALLGIRSIGKQRKNPNVSKGNRRK